MTDENSFRQICAHMRTLFQSAAVLLQEWHSNSEDLKGQISQDYPDEIPLTESNVLRKLWDTEYDVLSASAVEQSEWCVSYLATVVDFMTHLDG